MKKNETNNLNKIKKSNKLIDKLLNITLASSIAFSGFQVTRNIIVSNTSCLKPQTQINMDADLFDADLDIMKFYNNNHITRLKHNGDEPIFVTIDKDITDEKLKTNIHKSLEYVENIFTDINDKYRFQVVDKETANLKKTFSKTVIEYTTSSKIESSTYGNNLSKRNKTLLEESLNFNLDNVYNINSVITINEKYINEGITEDKLLSILIHELLHSFGLGDIYSNDLDRLTFMNVNYGFFSEIISPNDLRNLYAAYCEKHIKENGELDFITVHEIQQKIKTYEEEYYKHINEKIIKKTMLTDIKNFNTLNGTFAFIINNKKYRFNINYKNVDLRIYDSNNKLEKTYTGEAIYGGKFATIKGFYDETNKSTLKLYFSLFKKSDNNLVVCKIDNQSTANIIFTPNEKQEEYTL